MLRVTVWAVAILMVVVPSACSAASDRASGVEAVQGLVSRLLGPRAISLFDFGLTAAPVTGNDVFHLLPSSNGSPFLLQAVHSFSSSHRS